MTNRSTALALFLVGCAAKTTPALKHAAPVARTSTESSEDESGDRLRCTSDDVTYVAHPNPGGPQPGPCTSMGTGVWTLRGKELGKDPQPCASSALDLVVETTDKTLEERLDPNRAERWTYWMTVTLHRGDGTPVDAQSGEKTMTRRLHCFLREGKGPPRP